MSAMDTLQEQLVDAFSECDLLAKPDETMKAGRCRIAVDARSLLRGVVDPVIIVAPTNSDLDELAPGNESLIRFLTREFRLADNSLAIILLPKSAALELGTKRPWIRQDSDDFLAELTVSRRNGRDFLCKLMLNRFPLRRITPYQSNRAVSAAMFFGRQTDIDDLCTFGFDSSNYVVVGPRRGGKTSLGLEVQRRLRTEPEMRLRVPASRGTERYLYSVSYVDVATLVDYDFLWDAILRNMGLEQRDLAGGIRKRLGIKYRREVVDKPDFQLLADLLEHKYQRSVLLLDEVDNWLEWDRELGWPMVTKLRVLTDNLRARTKIVLLGYEKLFKVSKNVGFPLYGRFETKRIANLEREGVRALIGFPMEEMGVKVHDLPQIAGMIDHATGGMPNLIQGVCQSLIRWMDRNKVREIAPRDVSQLLHDEGDTLIDKVFLAFNELGDPLARLIAYESAFHNEVTVPGLLEDLRSRYKLNVDDLAVRDAVDYLYLHNVLQSAAPVRQFSFASDLLRKRLESELPARVRSTFLATLAGTAREEYGSVE